MKHLKNLRLVSCILSLILLYAPRTFAQEAGQIRACGDRPEIFLESPLNLSIETLPKNLFVARIASFWIESKDGRMKMQVDQNFKTGHKNFVCATFPHGLQKTFSMFAPALLDRTLGQKTGTAIWQFRTLMEDGRLGVWNQKSNIFSATQFFALANQHEMDMHWSQAGPDDFRIRFQKTEGDFNLILVIDFDQLNN